MANIVMRSFGGVAAVGAGAAASMPVAGCDRASDKEKDKATDKEKKEATKISNTFDPEALERGAKALREINASPYAKKVRADDTPARISNSPHLQSRTSLRIRQTWASSG
jgi:hypothetical protein